MEQGGKPLHGAGICDCCDAPTCSICGERREACDCALCDCCHPDYLGEIECDCERTA